MNRYAYDPYSSDVVSDADPQVLNPGDQIAGLPFGKIMQILGELEGTKALKGAKAVRSPYQTADEVRAFERAKARAAIDAGDVTLSDDGHRFLKPTVDGKIRMPLELSKRVPLYSLGERAGDAKLGLDTRYLSPAGPYEIQPAEGVDYMELLNAGVPLEGTRLGSLLNEREANIEFLREFGSPLNEFDAREQWDMLGRMHEYKRGAPHKGAPDESFAKLSPVQRSAAISNTLGPEYPNMTNKLIKELEKTRGGQERRLRETGRIDPLVYPDGGMLQEASGLWKSPMTDPRIDVSPGSKLSSHRNIMITLPESGGPLLLDPRITVPIKEAGKEMRAGVMDRYGSWQPMLGMNSYLGGNPYFLSRLAERYGLKLPPR